MSEHEAPERDHKQRPYEIEARKHPAFKNANVYRWKCRLCGKGPYQGLWYMTEKETRSHAVTHGRLYHVELGDES